MKRLLYLFVGFFGLLGLYAFLSHQKENQNNTIVPVAYSHIEQVLKSSNEVLVTFRGGATTTISQNEDYGSIQDVSIVDINYDGKDDILVSTVAGAYNLSTVFYIFDDVQKKFTEYTGFKDALNIEEDYIVLGAVDFKKEDKKLTSFFKGRGLGDMYTLVEFSFLNGTWYQSKSEIQDVLNYDAFDSTSWYYYRTIVEYDSNHATTSEKTTYYVQKADGDVGELIEVPKKELVKKKLIK